MDTLTSFLSNNSLWGIILAVGAVVLIVGIIKSLFRMAMMVAVIGLVMVVFFNFKPQEVIDKGKDLADKGSELLEGNLLMNNSSDDDKDFFIKQENGETIVEIEALGISYSLKDILAQLNQHQGKNLQEMLKN